MMPMPASPSAPSYRRDIDGLRAIAVLSVLLFHLHLPWITGGFAGVDVFFVISGYLITRIVHREILGGEFSVIGFYERRVRRIYPALLALLAGVVIAGFAIFMPDELRDLGASVLATVTFCSNLLFWQQTDYFAGPAEFKPLLHTWSLAVEEQFYILLPPLMALLHRFAPRTVSGAVVGMALASFAASCTWSFIDPSGNYFLPHTRAWELLVGSMLAVGIVPPIRGDRLNQLVAAAALVAVVAPFFLLDETVAFPAWNALATCLGTAALIHTGHHRKTFAATILAVRPLVAVGLISYSVYLVHWPVIAYARYYLLRDLTAGENVAVFAASLALGWFFWRFIERPFRHRDRFARNRLFAGAALASLALALVGAASFASRGFPQRLGANARYAVRDDAQAEQTTPCFLRKDWQEWGGDGCFLVRGAGPVTLLWGDSHANQYATSIRARAGTIAEPVLLYASGGCPPVFGVAFDGRKSCSANNDHAIAVIRAYHVRRVLLSAYWQREFEKNDLTMAPFAKTVARLRAMGLEVAVIGDNPDFAFANPQYLALRLAQGGRAAEPFYTVVRNDLGFNARLRAAAAGTAFYDPMAKLCRGRACLAFDRGQLMMRDNAHFSTFGAATALDAMRPFAMR